MRREDGDNGIFIHHLLCARAGVLGRNSSITFIARLSCNFSNVCFREISGARQAFK